MGGCLEVYGGLDHRLSVGLDRSFGELAVSLDHSLVVELVLVRHGHGSVRGDDKTECVDYLLLAEKRMRRALPVEGQHWTLLCVGKNGDKGRFKDAQSLLGMFQAEVRDGELLVCGGSPFECI